METVRGDPIHALSLARTALSDPSALPLVGALEATCDLRWEPSDSNRVAYAIEMIDRAIAGLYFEPFENPALEACTTLANVTHLVSLVVEGLAECEIDGGSARSLGKAVERLVEARTLLVATAH